MYAVVLVAIPGNLFLDTYFTDPEHLEEPACGWHTHLRRAYSESFAAGMTIAARAYPGLMRNGRSFCLLARRKDSG